MRTTGRPPPSPHLPPPLPPLLLLLLLLLAFGTGRCAQREPNSKQQHLGTASPPLAGQPGASGASGDAGAPQVAPKPPSGPKALGEEVPKGAGAQGTTSAAATASPTTTTTAVAATTTPMTTAAATTSLPPPPTTVDPHAPFVDKAHSKNVTALLGKTAYLNCRVKNLGNKTVSWVRHRDIHLLTVARYTYTNDQRFRATHNAMSDDWMLQLKYPQHRDAGIYECQVSTTPHLSHFIHLSVVEPKTEIIGGPDLFIDRGSTINLTCVVLHSPEPPAYVFWDHNDSIISYDSPRGGVTVTTVMGDPTTSVLLIQKARPADSGQYKCNPSNAHNQHVNVLVLNGELPAAMQHGGQGHHKTSHLAPLMVSALAALLWLGQRS